MGIEHVNLVVTNPRRSADLFERIFDWRTRWSGSGLDDEGEAIHVGTADTYVALVSRPTLVFDKHEYPVDRPGLAHVGVLVDDLDDVEGRVHAEGIETFNQNAIAPGRRFYFLDYDEVCWEVVSYEAPDARPSDLRLAPGRAHEQS